jgi:dGTPase
MIGMSEPVARAFKDMRTFMHRRVYSDPVAKAEEYKAEKLVEVLFDYFSRHTDELPAFLREMAVDDQSRIRAVCDYISAMSDRFAIAKYEELFIPKSWSVL